MGLRQGVIYQYDKAAMGEYIIPVSGGFIRRFYGGLVRLDCPRYFLCCRDARAE